MTTLKTLPHSEEAEAGVLGSILLDPDCLTGISLKPSDFYDKRNSLLWETIIEMFHTNSWIDALSISDYLKKTGRLDGVGGFDRLLELQNDTLVPSHSQHYAQIVLKASKSRSEIDVLSDGLEVAYRGESASAGVLARLTAIPDEKPCDDSVIIDSWERARDGKHDFVPHPYNALNILTGGAPLGMHTVFCGRSGSGKSIYLANWYEYLDSIDFPFLVMPFEDKFLITKSRMAACRGEYSWGLIHRGEEWTKYNGKYERVKVTQDQLQKAKDTLATFKNTAHFYDRRARVDDLFSIATQHKAKYGIKALFVDGAKDIQRPSGKYSDTGFDEEISQAMCKIAEELDISVISVYHLTKIPDGEMITTNGIRGSGNISSDARCVIALQSKGMSENGIITNQDEQGNQTTRMLDVLKSNHSGLGRVTLETDFKKCKFHKEGE